MLFDDIRPTVADAAAYASADDLLTITDLIEVDVTIKRWRRNGAPLKLRIRALDLDQQDTINQESLVKNSKTGEWETSMPVFCAASLRELVIVPKLTNAQAQAMRKHNPNIIKKLVDFGWSLSALDDESIEKAAHALAGITTHEETEAGADAGDTNGD